MIYELPQIPLSEIDTKNRRAAATGSMRRAMLTADADYNGHWITVSFKPHAVSGPIWNAEYFWAGRIVLGRGAFERCVAVAKEEYNRGARGTVVKVYVDEASPETIDEQIAILGRYGYQPESAEEEQHRRVMAIPPIQIRDVLLDTRQIDVREPEGCKS